MQQYRDTQNLIKPILKPKTPHLLVFLTKL